MKNKFRNFIAVTAGCFVFLSSSIGMAEPPPDVIEAQAKAKVETILSAATVKACIDTGCNSFGSAVHIGGGYFLTAGHVGTGVKELYLQTDNGKAYTSVVDWTSNAADFSLLHLKEPLNTQYFAVAKVDCRDMKIGEKISAVGNPIIFDNITVHGEVIGFQKNLKGDASAHNVNVLDLAIAGGNSGGPVLDGDGDVIGIVVAQLNANPNIAIAEPVTKVCDLLPIMEVEFAK